MNRTDWDYDIVIIGGGPSGLTAAQYVARANLKALVLERGLTGGQTLLISELENYPGIKEPITGFQFIQQMTEQAKDFGAEIDNNEAKKIEKKGEIFFIETEKGTIRTPVIILATGAKHRFLGIPNEERLIGYGISYCATCDGPMFKNKKLLVVGGGDSACGEAQYLSNITDKIVLIHRRGEFRAQQSLVKRVEKNPKVEIRMNQSAIEIIGDKKVEKVKIKNNLTNEEYIEEFDGVFIFVGSQPVIELVPDVEKDSMNHIITNQNMESSIPGLYAIGDVRSTPFKQIVVGAGEGAIAAHKGAERIEELLD